MEHEPNSIEIEASRWAARLDAGPLSGTEQAELDHWVSSDRRRHGALIRAQAAWLDADRLAALAGSAASAASREARPQSRRAFTWALAACVAVLCVTLAVLGYFDFPGGQTYASEIGEVRRIELPDGSQLALNTDTRATVHFGKSERDVALQRGEALFTVAHDASRPFVVYANDVRVRAVGTAFVVRVDNARVDILVTEGVVELARGADVQRVTANHKAVIASSDSRLDIEPVDPPGVSRQLAWREGMAAFAGEPLSVAVAEINRHSRHQIYVDDPALAAQPVIGIFHANDAEQFANAAAATFGAQVVRENESIHLRAPAR
jgi:transmembrane sensor